MIHEFKAQITSSAAGSLTARIAPFGVAVPYGSRTVEFAVGSIHVPQSNVPLTLDHADGVLSAVGVMTRSFETTDALFAEFTLADTEAGRDVRELLKLGAVNDVSVGIALTEDFEGGIMSGTLDHVSVVSHGRIPNAEVLSVHDDKEPTVAEEEEATAPVVAYDDEELKQTMAEMADKIDTFTTKVVDEPALFSSLSDFVETMADDRRGMADAVDKMAKFALASDTTTGASGVVPDYLSSEYLSIIDTTRAFNNNIPQDPIGSAGMSVVYPKRTSGPSVAEQVTENTEVDSTALVIGIQTVALKTYAGANKVSQQLITRSQPGFVDILFRELAGQYASVTDAASIATAVAAAGDSNVLADLSTDAAVTFAAFNDANAAVIAGVRKPADTVWLAPDRWAQLNSLTDSSGRPLLVYGPNNPSNAQGQSQFNTMVAQYHGWTVRLDVDAATGTCLIANSMAMANLEQSPVQLSALQVDTLSTDIGIYGLQNIIVKFPAGLATLTLV